MAFLSWSGPRISSSFLSWFRFELKINLLSYGDGEKLAYLNDNSYNMEEVLLLH